MKGRCFAFAGILVSSAAHPVAVSTHRTSVTLKAYLLAYWLCVTFPANEEDRRTVYS